MTKIADALRDARVSTMSDLDRWIREHPQAVMKGPHKGEREYMSRYQALKQLVGESTAIEVLNNLAIEECTACTPKRGRSRR